MDSIYVERRICAPMERVWELTQNPALHQRWDLRFTRITYLDRADDGPQQFLYETRIGLGLKISGQGETVGEQNRPDGTRTSALKFWSDDPRALIKIGSGYWQYEPDGNGLKFRTRYDYEPRYGRLGRLLDLLFRPLLGWATAWSFDAMRLWAEQDIPPEQSRRQAAIHLLARATLAFAWIYHGLVPKLLFRSPGEAEMSLASGVPANFVDQVVIFAGWAECLFGFALLVFWRTRWLLGIQIPFLLLIWIPLAIRRPDLMTQPFQPITLNLALFTLAVIGLLASTELPTARHCLRRQA